ncbi:MAG: dihydropteroate synthase [Fretibacterium sp.]|nr:dihydropteroate synthase [Fretibacterium sp.]
MGTMLQARGLKLRELPEQLNLSQPDLIESIHREYLEAGADFVTTNTFGANPWKLEKAGLSVSEVVGSAVKIARRAADPFGGRVALDIGPSGKVMAPLGDAAFEDVFDSVALQVKAGAQGCDVVLLETFTDLYELKASVLAVKEHCDLPIYATMSFEASGRTFFGASLESMVLTLEALGVAALGLNCSLGPAQLRPLVERLCELAHVPVMVQPNAGLPVMRDGVSGYDVTSDEFAAIMAGFAEKGAGVLGGCCGTNPGYISKTVKAVGQRQVTPRSVPRRTGVCSAAKAVFFDDTVIIGERLNPTGKKALQAALRAQDMDFLLREAVAQQEQGAHVLDVNVGLPDVDEPALLKRAVTEIQGVLDLPLQIDSADPVALEAAARIANGKPLLNSVNGKEESLRTVLPIARKYGACVLGLTLDEGGIPETAEGRLAVARRIVEEAEKLGIPREDVLIDCLTLTASAQQDLVRETLEAVRRVREELGVRTVLGVSNVSFGLPRRAVINRTMLALALMQGLDAAIMNPADAGMMETVAAWRVLSGRDRDSQDYIAYCEAHPEATAAPSAGAGGPQKAQKAQETQKKLSETGDLASAVAKGLKERAATFTRDLLESLPPLEVVERHIVPALDSVGRDYEAQKIFLPQLIKAAEAAKSSFEVLRVALASDPDAKSGEPVAPVALATVYGDIHDIGKNIVKVLMENYNFKVLDLGKDVPPEAVAEAVRQNDIRIVGLSALMTTTVVGMKDTIALLRRECPEAKVIVGGAVLTPDMAEFVGADHYARDAMETVRIATKLATEADANVD